MADIQRKDGQNVNDNSTGNNSSDGSDSNIPPPFPKRVEELVPEGFPEVNLIDTLDTFKYVFCAFYKTLEIAEVNQNQFIRTKFLEMSEVELETIRSSCTQLSKVTAKPLELYKILTILINGPTCKVTRAHEQTLVDLMENKDLNTV